MINWMRNAFLKLSPTYQLRTQVEQWYDADGTEEHVTNPIEIVRAVLCTESNVRRHSSESAPCCAPGSYASASAAFPHLTPTRLPLVAIAVVAVTMIIERPQMLPDSVVGSFWRRFTDEAPQDVIYDALVTTKESTIERLALMLPPCTRSRFTQTVSKSEIAMLEDPELSPVCASRSRNYLVRTGRRSN